MFKNVKSSVPMTSQGGECIKESLLIVTKLLKRTLQANHPHTLPWDTHYIIIIQRLLKKSEAHVPSLFSPFFTPFVNSP